MSFSHDVLDILPDPVKLSEELSIGNAAVTSKQDKKNKGQFYTPPEIGSYMASMISTTNKSSLKILDPGAGLGILSTSLIKELLKNKTVKEIELISYESDITIIDSLKKVMNSLVDYCNKLKVRLNYKIRETDYLLDDSSSNQYDLIISNPPYFKLAKIDLRAQIFSHVVHGQPNIYMLFMAKSAAELVDGGELVYIVPRSFASGPYFQKFREYFFNQVQPLMIHVFNARDKAFTKDSVLQENVIIKAKKIKSEFSPEIIVSSSNSHLDINFSKNISVNFDVVLNSKSEHKILYMPVSTDELDLIRAFKNMSNTLLKSGINVSTGPVVSFRALNHLRSISGPKNCPLIWLNNVESMNLKWPLMSFNKSQFIENCQDSKSLLVPSKNYVFVRRFSAKGDKSRLVACPFLTSSTNADWIGIENKLNYIYKKDEELTQEEALGIAALLNSSVYNNYYGVFNGNTQVSATELRNLPMPTMSEIREVGHLVVEGRTQAQTEEFITSIIARYYDKN